MTKNDYVLAVAALKRIASEGSKIEKRLTAKDARELAEQTLTLIKEK